MNIERVGDIFIVKDWGEYTFTANREYIISSAVVYLPCTLAELQRLAVRGIGRRSPFLHEGRVHLTAMGALIVLAALEAETNHLAPPNSPGSYCGCKCPGKQMWCSLRSHTTPEHVTYDALTRSVLFRWPAV